MEDTYVQSFEGAPEPADVFEPHMPGVDLFTDMDARFRTARDTLAKGDIPGEAFRQGQRAVAIMTPGRLIMFQPCPAPGSMPASAVEQEQWMFPPEPPLNISVVSYTYHKALIEDPSNSALKDEPRGRRTPDEHFMTPLGRPASDGGLDG